VTLFPLLLLAACAPDYNMTPAPPDVDPGDVMACPFSQVGDTDFYAYDCNPVFTTSSEEWAPTIGSAAFAVTRVLDYPFYQIWYSGMQVDGMGAEQMGTYGIGYGVSANGTDWETNPSNPLMAVPTQTTAWDYSNMDALQVLWDPSTSQYVMLYQGYNINNPRNSIWGMGVATSPDGVVWDKLASNPVIDLTTSGVAGVQGWCWPLGLSLGQTAGYTGYIGGYARANGACQVYSFRSADVATWTPKAEVVLPAGQMNAWDDQGAVSLSVAELEGTYYMFYAGFGDWDTSQPGVRMSKNHYFGVATSPDGENWTKWPDYVPLNRTPEGSVQAIHAYTMDKRILIWVDDDYSDLGFGQAVGYFMYDPHRGETDTGETGAR